MPDLSILAVGMIFSPCVERTRRIRDPLAELPLEIRAVSAVRDDDALYHAELRRDAGRVVLRSLDCLLAADIAPDVFMRSIFEELTDGELAGGCSARHGPTTSAPTPCDAITNRASPQ